VGGGGGTSSFVVEDGPASGGSSLFSGEMSNTAKRMVTEDGFLMTQGTVGVDSGSQWEIHPEGDEILTLLEGAVDVYFEQKDEVYVFVH
jgi:quercetin dioxygenase-like cupin family protein